MRGLTVKDEVPCFVGCLSVVTVTVAGGVWLCVSPIYVDRLEHFVPGKLV